jgi:hypothetical protein
MQPLAIFRRLAFLLPLLAASLSPRFAQAAWESAGWSWPVLWGKSWLIGYAVLFLGILLGMLAVLIPSMRRRLRKKDT